MDEHDVLRAWRGLFQGKEVSAETLDQAKDLLERLSGESPLFIRLSNELDELKIKHDRAGKNKRTAGRS